MLFPSFTFILFFLPVTLALYYLFGAKNRTAAHIWLVLASFVFYSWFNYSYFLILLGSILGNYFLSSLLWRKPSKIVFILGVLANICLLGYYKYCDFFIDNINHLLELSIPFKHIVLPLGISFFTFQQISFLHAVYTGELKKRYSFITYSIFVSFFPQLVAGPIVLPDEMMEQFDRPESLKLQAQNFSAGLFVFSLGLGKKILLADYFATFADAGFASGALTLFDAWKTALSYTFQIYFDFSGYCDMACVAVQHPSSGKLPFALSCHRYRGFLEKMAYYTGQIPDDVCLFSLGWQSGLHIPYLLQLDDHVSGQWALAWSQLVVCVMGRGPWGSTGDSADLEQSAALQNAFIACKTVDFSVCLRGMGIVPCGEYETGVQCLQGNVHAGSGGQTAGHQISGDVCGCGGDSDLFPDCFVPCR